MPLVLFSLCAFYIKLEKDKLWDSPSHWGKSGKFSLKIEKSEVKIGPIFGLRPLVDTLAYPKIPFLGQDLV